jgi:hypothetical protein
MNPGRPNFCSGEAPGQNTSVGGTSVQILAANSDRLSVILTNYGSRGVWLAFDATAEKEKGIYLDKSKGQIVFDSGAVSKGPLNAISDFGTTQLAWQEFTRS